MVVFFLNIVVSVYSTIVFLYLTIIQNQNQGMGQWFLKVIFKHMRTDEILFFFHEINIGFVVEIRNDLC
ncbi:MAG: hypothetical protein BGN88_04280 [Clostridiales bacterium 43-6]|nr:MAG: hypothetical protein BGN88_04280 [Clostridiales bacterium 43-6]